MIMAAVAALLAAGVVGVKVSDASSRADDDEAFAVRSAPADAASPHREPSRPDPDTSTTSAPPTASAAPPEPLFDVDTHDAGLDELHASDAAAPVRITVGDIQVDAPITPAGVADDGSGELEVPSNADAVVWYQFGPSPGADGSAVVAGHVDYNGARGSFFHLEDLRPGALVTVDYDDGSQQRFRVSDRRRVAKVALPTDEIFNRSGPPRLHLITCGGDFDSAAQSYRDNVVVQALPVAG